MVSDEVKADLELLAEKECSVLILCILRIWQSVPVIHNQKETIIFSTQASHIRTSMAFNLSGRLSSTCST